MHLKDSCVGLPQWLSSKESACSAGDEGSTPGSGRPGGGHGNPPQYSCLENPMDRGYGIRGCKESDGTEATEHIHTSGRYQGDMQES